MSLYSPYESAPYSYDIFYSDQQELASGTVSIKVYIPKLIASIPTTAVNEYKIDVVEIGELSVKFDTQNEAGDITGFKFNVPSFSIKVRDVVSITTQSIVPVVSRFSEALMDVPNGFVSVIELTYNNKKNYFYSRKTDFSFDIESRIVEIDGTHPLAMSAVPFGKDNFNTGSYTQAELRSFAGYFGQDGSGITFFPSGNLYTSATVATPFYGPVQFKTVTAYNFIGTVMRYLAEDVSNNVEIDSLVFSDSVRTVDFGGSVGSKNCVVLMAGELYALPKSSSDELTANTIDNFSGYTSETDWYIRTLPSTDSLASGVSDEFRRIDNDAMKSIFVKMARMDAAFFGSILGETFYISRAKKNSSYRVVMTEDQFLSLKIKQENIDPSTLSFTYPVSRSSFTGGNFVHNMVYNETINRQGSSKIDIDFEPATYFSFYEDEDRNELGQNMSFAKVALVNDGNQATASYLLAPIYYNSSTSSYDTDFSIEGDYYSQYSEDVATAYRNALNAGTGVSISGEINGIDTLKPYEYIRVSSIHPAINDRDFRISSISYDLVEDKISFEAYEF